MAKRGFRLDQLLDDMDVPDYGVMLIPSEWWWPIGLAAIGLVIIAICTGLMAIT